MSLISPAPIGDTLDTLEGFEIGYVTVGEDTQQFYISTETVTTIQDYRTEISEDAYISPDDFLVVEAIPLP